MSAEFLIIGSLSIGLIFGLIIKLILNKQNLTKLNT